MIEGTYREKVFYRLGYYIHHEYVDEALKENPPEEVIWDKLQRVIIAEKPIITKPQIRWDVKENKTIVPGGEDLGWGDPFEESLGVFEKLEACEDATKVNWAELLDNKSNVP